jgi:hypothetical protein
MGIDYVVSCATVKFYPKIQKIVAYIKKTNDMRIIHGTTPSIPMLRA